jgi:threonine/homoserine/homoserine lactone efflux protein
MPNFLLFLATSIAITMAPGPDNLQVLARGISQGRAAGLVAALGFAAGITFHTTLATLGVAALLRSSPIAFQAIKGSPRLTSVRLNRCGRCSGKACSATC